MKSYSIKTQIGILAAAVCLLFSGCALDDEWYSETTPDTFFRNKGDVYKVLNRPFTHLFWYDVGQRPPRPLVPAGDDRRPDVDAHTRRGLV